MSRVLCLLLCAGMIGLPANASAEERIDIARFSRGDIDGWVPKVFSGVTRYALESENGRLALRADSRASASGLYRELRVDLAKTPILNWSWRVGNVLSGHDERSRAGDDYPARVYVVFSGGLAFWRTRAINYVWSGNQPVGSVWPNAFTGNARMIAVRSGPEHSGVWLTERRDVRADYMRQFGNDPGPAAAVAIMTDTDNTGGSATAWYGDIWFSAE